MKNIKWMILASLSGILSGLTAATFLISLDWATGFRESHPHTTYLLPFGGLCIGLFYHYFGSTVKRGTNLIIDEIHDPKKVIPFRMSPLVLFSTILTHLFGGSAGREGAIVQVSASLSDQLSRLFKIETKENKMLLIAGTGAGFSAAIGTPWAGFLFGMEVISIGRLRPIAIIECLIASFISYYLVVILNIEHTQYPAFDIPPFEIKSAAYVIVAGIFFGLCAMLFVKVFHLTENALSRLIPNGPLKTFLIGFLLVALFQIEGSGRFEGLGLSQIFKAMQSTSDFSIPVIKGLFTSLTVGSGFKGGEFIPLVFIGTTLGSALSMILPLSLELLSRLGFAAVFAAASNTPIACSIMATELFGLGILPYALLACFAAYYSSGHHGIYRSQRIHSRKLSQIRNLVS